jgi:hypothetical protein
MSPRLCMLHDDLSCVLDRSLGTAIVHIEPLMSELHSMKGTLEKRYRIFLNGEKIDNLASVEAAPENLEIGALTIQFGIRFKA